VKRFESFLPILIVAPVCMCVNPQSVAGECLAHALYAFCQSIIKNDDDDNRSLECGFAAFISGLAV